MTLPAQQEPPVQPPAPPATQGDPKPAEHMIPKSRLDEVLEQNKKLQEQVTTANKERQDQLEAQLKEQGKWKELAETRAQELANLKPKADQVDEYEKVLQEQLAEEIENLPDDFKDVIPEGLSTKDKLRWLVKNKSKFVKPEPFDIGAGKRGVKQDKKPELSADEKQTAKHFGVSEEDYQKFKDNNYS